MKKGSFLPGPWTIIFAVAISLFVLLVRFLLGLF